MPMLNDLQPAADVVVAIRDRIVVVVVVQKQRFDIRHLFDHEPAKKIGRSPHHRQKKKKIYRARRYTDQI